MLYYFLFFYLLSYDAPYVELKNNNIISVLHVLHYKTNLICNEKRDTRLNGSPFIMGSGPDHQGVLS